MRSFLDWLDEKGFWVKEHWDFDKERMAGPGRLVLTPEQRRILGHVLTPDDLGKLPYTTLLYSCPKKSGKTAVGAAIVCWAADEFEPGSEIYVIANDEEQGKSRVFRDVLYHVEHEVEGAYSLTGSIEWPNGTTCTVLAKEYKSAAGSRHALTGFDGLWACTTESGQRMYSEMTPILTVPISLRVIVTYAGYEGESQLLWDLYERGVGPEEYQYGRGAAVPGFDDLPCWYNNRLFCYWDHERRMPWQQDESYYAEEEQGLRASDFLRMHYNQWVSGQEAFLPPEWWTEASKAYPQSAELWDAHPYRYAQVFVGVDVAPKHDCSAVVGVTYDSTAGKVILLFHHIWTPLGELDLEATVEDYLVHQSRRFAFGAVDYDPAQFHRSMITLRNKYRMPMRQFTQTVENMVKASQGLYDLLRAKRLSAYPDKEAAQHLRNAQAQNSARGFRIVKDPAIKGNKQLKTRKPVDFAVALAMATYAAVELGAVDVTQVLRVESPFSDVSAWPYQDPAQLALPFPFRTEL